MRHIHADLMIAAANDTSIEWQAVGPLSREWIYTGKSGEFMFYPDSQYRQRPQPHPHQAMMDQAKADPSIEWQLLTGLGCWIDCIPGWSESWQYRQKPKMVEMWQWAKLFRNGAIATSCLFYASKEAAQDGECEAILCRIEGSKITVPEVSQ